MLKLPISVALMAPWKSKVAPSGTKSNKTPLLDWSK